MGVERKKERWLTENGLVMLRCWARDGLTKEQIAERMGINRKTLWEWSSETPEILAAIEEGREVTDFKVESALLQTALGCKKRIVKTVISGNPDKDGNRPVRIEKTEEDILPNVTAILAWLNNRKPDQWKRNRDNMLELSEDDSNITVNIFRHDEKSDGKTKVVRKGKTDEEKEDWNLNSKNESSKKSSIESNTDKEISTEEDEWLNSSNDKWPEEGE